MDNPLITPKETIFRPPSPDNQGIFVLHKSFFLIEGHNFPRAGRCDNLTYTGVAPTYNTPYEAEALTIGSKQKNFLNTQPTTDNGLHWSQFLEVPGKFVFTFTYTSIKSEDGLHEKVTFFEDAIYPASLWFGRSLIEFFKIIREWSMLVDEPFNLDHPMAVYSKMVFDILNPPDSVIREIDSLPDMHLVRFLKRDENHRARYDDFPQMSDSMKEWFLLKMEQYPKTNTRHKLRNITIS